MTLIRQNMTNQLDNEDEICDDGNGDMDEERVEEPEEDDDQVGMTIKQLSFHNV